MTSTRQLKIGMSALSATILAAGLIVGGLGLKESLAQETPALQPAAAAPASPAAAPAEAKADRGMVAAYDFLAVALCVGMACLGAGYAVAKVGSAALGAVTEKPELMGRALIIVGLAEGIAIYGLIFGILLLRQL